MEKRRRFSSQFKAEAVQMVIQTGHPITQVARELEMNAGTLGNWVNAWKRENPEPEPELTPVDRARMSEMQREIRELRLENEFLKERRRIQGVDATLACRIAAGVLESRRNRGRQRFGG